MHIETVTIRNFRSLKNITLRVDKYGAFIGANGSGKSSVLYALDWFFNDTRLSVSDVHGCESEDCVEPSPTIEVGVTFCDLTDKDRERLQQYGRGERAEIRRTWYADGSSAKTVGNARQGPGFAEVRLLSGAAARRAKYREVREQFPELPDLGGSATKDAIAAALDAWEADPGNAGHLVEVPDADANQMMGWNGGNVLRECVRFVLIPAATSISGEVGSASRGSALAEVVGTIMAEASARARASWLEKHAEAVNELSGDIRKSVELATGAQASRINSRLETLIPNASVSLTPSVPEFTPKLEPSIATDVTIAGVTNDVARQGHGVQRAVMISMFQVMVPDADFTRTHHTALDGEDATATDERLAEALAALPSVIVAIEEPEIYQHPVRARAFARTLIELSEQKAVQVLLATHSPYFIQPEQFDKLHRFTYAKGETSVATATAESVALDFDHDVKKVRKTIVSSVPTEFSEGFFAEAVVLVEGPTDRILIETIASKIGKDLDRLGVTVLAVDGKGGLRVTRAILKALGIPIHILADGDYGTAALATGKTPAEVAEKHESHRSATEKLVQAMPTDSKATHGTLPYVFGEPSVVCSDYTIWKDDVEEELGKWTSFIANFPGGATALATRSHKNTLSYRNAAVGADEADLPVLLRAVVTEIARLSTHDAKPPEAATSEPTAELGAGS